MLWGRGREYLVGRGWLRRWSTRPMDDDHCGYTRREKEREKDALYKQSALESESCAVGKEELRDSKIL